jgi:hypothetical protein
MNVSSLIWAVLVVGGIALFVYIQLLIKKSIEPDEHTNCECTGCCGGDCNCDYIPDPGNAPTMEAILADQHFIAGMGEFVAFHGDYAPINPSYSDVVNKRSVFAELQVPAETLLAIMERLADTNQALHTVLQYFGYCTNDLSLSQLLKIDDKLYRCNVCGYWCGHGVGILKSLWKCPRCASVD